MSIPGIFAPVILEDQMLVDGGMANNLPVSVVREMGADIVIAVDISAPLLNRKELDSVLAVTEQLTTFLTRTNMQVQIASLGPRDVLLVPELEGFGSTDFDQVLSIVPAGYESAMVSKAAFAGLSQPTTDGIPEQRQSRSPEPSEYIVQYVQINNSSVLNDEIIRSRLDVTLGEPLDYERLEASISYIYSMDVFQAVTYNLVRNESGETGIEINAIPRSWGPNYLQFGLQFSDDFSGNSDYQIGMAYTRSALNSLAGELRFDLNFGRDGLLEFDFYQPIDQRARWFIEPRAAWSRRVINVYDDDEFRAQVEVYGVGTAFGLGRNFDTANLLRLDYEFYRGKADLLIGDSSLLTDDDVDLGELVLQYQHDSLDDLWFPQTGQLFRAAARVAMDELGASSDYQQAYLGGLLAYSWGKNSSQLNYQLGYSFEDAVPIERWYQLGGLGRLSGLAPNQLSGRHMGLLTLALYRRLNDVEVFPVYAGFTSDRRRLGSIQVSFDSLAIPAPYSWAPIHPLGPCT
jgi:NTE family protein